MTELTIHTERVDDIPILFGFQQQMDIQETIDKINGSNCPLCLPDLVFDYTQTRALCLEHI